MLIRLMDFFVICSRHETHDNSHIHILEFVLERSVEHTFYSPTSEAEGDYSFRFHPSVRLSVCPSVRHSKILSFSDFFLRPLIY